MVHFNNNINNRLRCSSNAMEPLWSRIFFRGTLMFLFVLLQFWQTALAQRREISLNSNWYTIASSNDSVLPANSYQTAINTSWKLVNIPHNWDQYEGYRRMTHGNRHGDSWYRKTFTIRQPKKGRRFFLFFEGVGSYATVYLNNQPVGAHAGGRTTFTLDITDHIQTDGSSNEVAVRAWHPSGIGNLPWVCGGCSDERGFSEGSQPMGIFRPVHLLVTSDVRIEPFGVHAWADIQTNKALLSVQTNVRNYSGRSRKLTVVHRLIDAAGRTVNTFSFTQQMLPADSLSVPLHNIAVAQPKLWSVENPYLYTIISELKEKDSVLDKTETLFGFRTIQWKNSTHQFTLNGKPVFINGIAEYEHLLGQSHAFGSGQIASRMKWLQAAGFNAFRDGHQPHNLLYGQWCDAKGILWWTQLSAHVWYDSPGFRTNFKQLLKEWVIERRNSPSVILWGLQNESKLPEDFARECTELIRSLDPTASAQRLITTCNGGSGTDWDVPQNWTGTYGGNPATYGEDLKKQVLVGEYGAWRTIDLHTEGGFVQQGPLSEDRMVQLMEQKVRLAASVKDSVAGHFFWLLSSHDNPGRVQGGEGFRELDRIGPVNYKGLLTPWEEPTDAFYMYRSNYASKDHAPMVYIVSHTWPNRWMKPGIKDSIIVYSNCDEVELFNDIAAASLGRKKRNGIGTHFQWDGANIQYNLLYAVGYVNGKAVARDTILLHHLPRAPHFEQLYAQAKPLTRAAPGYHYLYRINCGGPAYRDENGNNWQADNGFVSSWTADYPELPEKFADQRRIFDPVKGSRDWELFQDFRYGRDKLRYTFPVPDGEYLAELYFIEPWLGVGGGINAKAMRLFNIAVNNKILIDDLDIWAEAGTHTALKKTVKATVSGGRLEISFPHAKAGQAIIAAIAIAAVKKQPIAAPASVIDKFSGEGCREMDWLDIGHRLYGNDSIRFNSLPPNLFGAGWIQLLKRTGVSNISFTTRCAMDVFVAVKEHGPEPDGGAFTHTEIITDENGGTHYQVYRKRYPKNETVQYLLDQQSMLAFLPVNDMQPAYDLKPLSAYRTNVAQVSEGVVKESFGGRDCAVIKGRAENFVQWPVLTGVADRYSITVKYFSPHPQPVKARLLLTDAGGNRMMEEAVQFTFTRTGKWNQFTVNTPTQINAGNYRVMLLVENGAGLAISGIEIQ